MLVDGDRLRETRLEHTNPFGTFPLAGHFDVGMNTGSPAIDEYDAKMPFKYTGSLRKVEIKLSEPKLTAQETNELHRRRRTHALAVQ